MICGNRRKKPLRQNSLDYVAVHVGQPGQLANAIPGVVNATGEQSIVLLGDTNCLGAWEHAVESIEEAGFVDLNGEDEPTFARGTAPFDRIFVRAERPEFKYSRQYVLRSANAGAHESYLSDHYLVKTSVKIYQDG